MKKILLVSHLLDYSGAPLALLNAAHSLIKSGYTVHLFSFKKGPLSDEFVRSGVLILEKINFEIYDLVILNTSVSATIYKYIPKRTSYILWLHESPALFLQTLIPWTVVQASKGAVGVFYPSKSLYDEWARYGDLRKKRNSSEFLFTPLTDLQKCDRAGVNKKIKNSSVIKIVTIDPVENFRGYTVVADALKQLSLISNFSVEWTAVGADHQKLIEIVGSHKKLTCYGLGRVTRQQVQDVINSSDIYISATAYASQNMGLFEALSCGIPSIVSDIPVHKEIKDEIFSEVFLYSLFDSTELMEKLIECINNYKEISKLFFEKKSEFTDNLSFDNFHKKFSKLIEDLS